MSETTIVELTTAPELFEEDDRIVVSAEGRTIPYGHPVRVTLLQRGAGDYHPFKVGDLLSCVVMQGRLMGGVHPVAFYGDVVPPQSMTNREIRAPRGGHLVLAPDRDAAGSEVRLGRETRDGATYQRLMMFDRLAAEVVSLKAQIDALAAHVGAMSAVTAATGATIGPIGTGAEAAVADATIAGGITGGDPSVGVKAAK